jgi:hypothetical protein
MRKPITPNESETRITDAYTGGQKGTKLARYDLIPVAPLEEVAKLYGSGALKYEDRNWEKGYAWSLSYSALGRHANAFWDGESIDIGTPEEPGTLRHHLAAVVFHAFALMEMQHRNAGTDDRPVPTSEIDIRKYGVEEVASWYNVHAESITGTPTEVPSMFSPDWHEAASEAWRKLAGERRLAADPEEVPYENEDGFPEPLELGARVMTLGVWEYEVTPGTIGEVVTVEERSPGNYWYEVEVPTSATKFGKEEEDGPTTTLLGYCSEVIAI